MKIASPNVKLESPLLHKGLHKTKATPISITLHALYATKQDTMMTSAPYLANQHAGWRTNTIISGLKDIEGHSTSQNDNNSCSGGMTTTSAVNASQPMLSGVQSDIPISDGCWFDLEPSPCSG